MFSQTIGVPARAFIYTQIKPLTSPPPLGPQAPLTINGFTNPYAGTYLHFLYIGNANMNYRTSSDPTQPDYVPQQISVEFEAPGTFTVPFDGTLQFVGGNPACEFLAYIYYGGRSCSEDALVGRIDTSNYSPMFHFLRHFPDPSGALAFTVPDNHTVLLGYDPAATFTVNGITVTPGVNLPGTTVSPGDLVVPTSIAPVAVTGWWG